jgi:CubicO group peptidase (beta-lactamase class C family)
LRNKTLLRSLACIFSLLSVGLLVPATAQTTFDDITIGHRADQWVRPYVAAGDFSGVVLIAKGDQVLIEKAYGKANFQHNVANQVGTRFRIASVSKTFTAAGIELLIVQGKLSLKDHLSKYVSGIPNGDSITVEHLLLHESGVGELDDPDVYRECLPNGELLRRLRKVPPMFAPGSDDHYSNEGYFLLAMIVEKVSGISFDSFMQKNVFDPLRLKNTGSTCLDPPYPNASGYIPGDKAASVVPPPFPEAAHVGSGSLYSNVEDLYTWLRAVDTNSNFSVDKFDYPYGWGKRNYSGRDLIEQSGMHEGFTSHVALYPKEHIYAVVLSNVQSGFFNRIPKDVEAVFFGGEPSRPPEFKAAVVSVTTLQEYQGEYKAESIPIPQNLVLRDGKLSTHWGSYPFLRVLTPTGKDEFFLRDEYAKVKFERAGKGSIASMVWQWPEGRPMTFMLVKPR